MFKNLEASGQIALEVKECSPFKPLNYNCVMELRQQVEYPYGVDDPYRETPNDAPGFSRLAEDFKRQLDELYKRFGIDPSYLACYRKYGELKSHNAGGDSLLLLRRTLGQYSSEISRAVTVLGSGFPLVFREVLPDADLIAFDINPNQHVSAGHSIVSTNTTGYVLDFEVPEMVKAFLHHTGPVDFLYLSNIIYFLSTNPNHREVCNRLAKIIAKNGVKTIVGSCLSPTQFHLTSRLLKGLQDNGYDICEVHDDFVMESGVYIAERI
jgi:hypothetical protein